MLLQAVGGLGGGSLLPLPLNDRHGVLIKIQQLKEFGTMRPCDCCICAVIINF